MKAFEPARKIGILATVNEDGQPHLTLISSLQANTPTELTFGQFIEGLSKRHVWDNPQTGFLIMTLDKRLWRGKATFTHTAKSGPEHERYNSQPMFRYNAYFGIHTVFYLDLVEHSGRQALPMSQITQAAVKTTLARKLWDTRYHERVLNPWTRQLMNGLSNPKFLSYIDADGYPVIVPIIQAQAADTESILFSTSAYADELKAILPKTTVAIFGLSLRMEDVLLRGSFQGIQRVAGVACGVVQVNWVYNSMPPKPQQIYPKRPLEAVTTFA